MRLPIAAPPPLAPLPSRVSPWARTLLTGHRGACAYARENSLASFRRAVAMGADVLECDVRLTRDGALILAHDGIVGRGRSVARIAALTEKQLRAYTRDVLTFAELLPFIMAHDVLLNVDLKVPDAEVPLVGTLAAHGLVHRTIVTSRASYQLRRLRALAPGLRLGLSKGSSPPRGPHGAPEWAALLTQRSLLPQTLPGTLRHARADAAYLHYRLVTPALVRSLHGAGYGVYAWTVDDVTVAEKLLEWGVDGITTNRPDFVRPLIDRCSTPRDDGRENR